MSKTSKRAILTYVIIATFLISMIPIMPAMAAVELADCELFERDGATADWVTAPGVDHGDDSVNLIGLAGDNEAKAMVYTSGITLGTIDLADLAFDYWFASGALPDLELRFCDPDCVDADDVTKERGHVDITFSELTGTTNTAWQTTDAFTTGDAVWVFGNHPGIPGAPFDAATLGESQGDPYSTIITNNLLSTYPAYADWELTRVSVQVGWGASNLIVDMVKIGSDTYDLEQLEATGDFSIDFVTGGDVVYDQVLTVIGSGVTGGQTVNIYWDYVTAANLLNSTTGLGSGAFESTVKVPSAYFGNHYLWVKDLASGISIRSDAISVTPKITLSPSSGLEGDDIVVKGYGFDVDSDVDITFPGTPTLCTTDGEDETDDLGYFEYTFEVDATVDNPYTVTATDADLNEASATFTVGAAISIDKTVGPAGTIVKVDGRGFTDGLSTIYYGDNITLGTYLVSTKDGNNITISGGKFTAYVIVPSVPEGDYKFTFTNKKAPTDGKTAVSETFTVDGETSITVTPSYGTPGTVLTVKGYNFTRISGTDVELALRDQTATAKTDASGSFTATIIIPPLDFGVSYSVTANDTRFCHAEDDVLVALMVLQLSAYSAPVGSKVMLMGSGLTLGGEWNATFGDIDLITEKHTTSGTTYFSEDFYVPSVPSGTYTIGVYDVARKITVNIDFTVTDQAALSVSRAAIPNKYNLTIKGTNFVERAGVSTQWYLYNSTHEWDLNTLPNVTYGGPTTVPITSSEKDEEGTFTGYYKIPEFLALGSYGINCTTISNAEVDPDVTQYAEVDIEIVPEELVINVGGPSYARGQTITFVIKTTLKKDPFDLGIKDPEGSEVFNSTWGLEHWKTLGSWYYIPSNLQIDDNTQWLYTLPADATPGTWTYSFWDEDKEYANGTFQVTYLTELEQLQQDIGELSSDIDGLGTSVIDLATTVAGVSGAAAEAATAAAAAATAAADAQAAAEAGIAAVEDMGEISQDALDAANNAVSAADAAKDAADAGLAAALAAQTTAQQAADAADKAADAAEATQKQQGGLTGLVYGAIGASLIAALAAIVSLMQISRRIAG